MINLDNIDVLRREAVTVNTLLQIDSTAGITDEFNDALQELICDILPIVNAMQGMHVVTEREYFLTEVASKHKARKKRKAREAISDETLERLIPVLQKFNREIQAVTVSLTGGKAGTKGANHAEVTP